jgi:hypothetical protein
MRNFNFLCAAALLSGCASTTEISSRPSQEPSKQLPSVQLTKEDVHVIETGTRSGLKDPESARFGRMIAGQDDGGIFVCLMVNAKNSYGGYTGEKPMMGLLFREKKTFALVPDDGKFPQYRDESILKVCADKGFRHPCSPRMTSSVSGRGI